MNLTDEQLNLAMCEWMGDVQLYAVQKGDLYYRPNSAGYTASISDCGRYTKEAGEREIVSGEPMTLVPLTLPNYLSDDSPRRLLNEAEARLAGQCKEHDYWFFLRELLGFSGAQCDWDEVDYFKAVTATARQRTIAILQTVKPEIFK